ncbi:MAG: hypothetical protein GXO68_04850, partial [Crenarchaeota archaeon]|nr:hypothetical protein [Thermoproteota archaeon]
NIVCQDTGMIFDLEPNEESSEIVNAIINAARKQGITLRKPVVVVKGFCTNGREVKP